QVISALTNLVLQRLKVLRARYQSRCLLYLSKLVKDFLYMPRVIGILTGQARTHHVDAPFRYYIIFGASSVIQVGLSAPFCLQLWPWAITIIGTESRSKAIGDLPTRRIILLLR